MLLSDLQKKALYSDAMKEYAEDDAVYYQSFLLTPGDKQGFETKEEIDEYLKLSDK